MLTELRFIHSFIHSFICTVVKRSDELIKIIDEFRGMKYSKTTNTRFHHNILQHLRPETNNKEFPPSIKRTRNINCNSATSDAQAENFVSSLLGDRL